MNILVGHRGKLEKRVSTIGIILTSMRSSQPQFDHRVKVWACHIRCGAPCVNLGSEWGPEPSLIIMRNYSIGLWDRGLHSAHCETLMNSVLSELTPKVFCN